MILCRDFHFPVRKKQRLLIGGVSIPHALLFMHFTFLPGHTEYFVGAVACHTEKYTAAVVFTLQVAPVGTEKKLSAELDKALDIFIAFSHTTPVVVVTETSSKHHTI